MKEKILIEGKPSVKIIPIVLFITGIILLIITITTHWSWDDLATVMYFISPMISIVGIVLYIMWSASSITVTDKRVYGKAIFGSRVDIPLDSISAVGTVAITNGITVSSSSGKISFAYISNSDEIHSILSKIIIERQGNNSTNIIQKENSNADELQKYKNLLDNGVITQEEFEAKKKQLLNL